LQFYLLPSACELLKVSSTKELEALTLSQIQASTSELVNNLKFEFSYNPKFETAANGAIPWSSLSIIEDRKIGHFQESMNDSIRSLINKIIGCEKINTAVSEEFKKQPDNHKSVFSLP
jgi:hypothetical protein